MFCCFDGKSDLSLEGLEEKPFMASKYLFGIDLKMTSYLIMTKQEKANKG